MPNTVERTLGDPRVFERDLCAGFAQCGDSAEEAFEVDALKVFGVDDILLAT